MTIPEIAAAALAILDEAGWTQDTCADSQGRVCMGTALCRAAEIPEDGHLTAPQLSTWIALTDAVIKAQRELCPEAPFDPATAVATFNDHSSEEEVRAVLERMRE